MRIDVHDIHRHPLFTVKVDPQRPPQTVQPSGTTSPQVPLSWENALDAQGCLRQCPVCQCHELFVRRDFPQPLGLAMVIAAVIASSTLFGLGHVQASFLVLIVMVVIDAGILHFLTGRCLVCYRCRSVFRDLPLAKDQHAWDLATGEKYRQLASPPQPHIGQTGQSMEPKP